MHTLWLRAYVVQNGCSLSAPHPILGFSNLGIRFMPTIASPRDSWTAKVRTAQHLRRTCSVFFHRMHKKLRVSLSLFLADEDCHGRSSEPACAEHTTRNCVPLPYNTLARTGVVLCLRDTLCCHHWYFLTSALVYQGAHCQQSGRD